jgi:hypothetical protein
MIVWAGDFNQSMLGPNLTGSTSGRQQVAAAFKALNLVAWNANEPHSKPGMGAIDLICGPDLVGHRVSSRSQCTKTAGSSRTTSATWSSSDLARAISAVRLVSTPS